MNRNSLTKELFGVNSLFNELINSGSIPSDLQMNRKHHKKQGVGLGPV